MDPGLSHDPTGIVGAELDGRSFRIRMARRFVATGTAAIASFLLQVRESVRPAYIGMEKNGIGAGMITECRRYGLDIRPYVTVARLGAKKRRDPGALDKNFMVEWTKSMLHSSRISFTQAKKGTDMAALHTEFKEIVGITTHTNHVKFQAMRGRHDDLFMAALAALNICRLAMDGRAEVG